MTTCSQVSMLASFTLGGETTWVRSDLATACELLWLPTCMFWVSLTLTSAQIALEEKLGQYEHCYNYVGNCKVLPAN